MIGLCFLFGYGLAALEAPAEIEANTQNIIAYEARWRKVESFLNTTEDGYDKCLNTYAERLEAGTVATDELISFMDLCTKSPKQVARDQLTKMKLEEGSTEPLTYNWNICYRDEATGASHGWMQSTNVYFKWLDSYKTLKEFYIGEGKSKSEAHEMATAQADGSEDCYLNVPGGATFWFTIMTTMGYGNTAPVTVEGRLLVYFMGFLSILLFSAAMGNAGSVLLTIVDDFFERVGLKRLTKGIAAVVFWLATLLLWLLVIAGIYWLWAEKHYGIYWKEDPSVRFKLSDAYWFAYISVTTVGFGDYFLPHDSIRTRDLFYNPLIILIGFILLANFLLKLGEMFVSFMKSSSEKLDNNMKSIVITRQKGGNKASDIHFDAELEQLRNDAAEEEKEEEYNKESRMHKTVKYDLAQSPKYDLTREKDDLSYEAPNEVADDGVSFDTEDQIETQLVK